jgi:hypothetical protein
MPSQILALDKRGRNLLGTAYQGCFSPRKDRANTLVALSSMVRRLKMQGDSLADHTTSKDAEVTWMILLHGHIRQIYPAGSLPLHPCI